MSNDPTPLTRECLLRKLRSTESEELTAHDVVALIVLPSFVERGLDAAEAVAESRVIADEFLIQKHQTSLS
jgi:hypothetical protein